MDPFFIEGYLYLIADFESLPVSELGDRSLAKELAVSQSEMTGIFVEVDIQYEVITDVNVFRTDT